MDEFYDTKQALLDLQEIEIQRGGKAKQRSTLHLADAQITDANIQEFANPQAWRVADTGDNETSTEIVFRVQGILSDKILPPIARYNSPQLMAKNRPHLRQVVTLTGLGSACFSECINTVEKLVVLFMNKFPADSMEPWEPSKFGIHEAMDANARYFMHAIDNNVQYYGRTPTGDNTFSMKAISPFAFKIGDVVEATISFIVVQIKSRYRFFTVLKGLLLLDQSVRNTADILRMRSKYKAPQKASVKRRAVYDLEEENMAETEQQLSKMRLD